MVGTGIVMLIVGGAGFIWSAPKMDAIRSGWGQLAIGLDASAASEAQMYQVAYYGSIVFMVLGAVFFIAGLIMRAQKKQ